MKIVYLSEHPLDAADGVSQKIALAVDTWRALGHEVLPLSLYEMLQGGQGIRAGFFPSREFVQKVVVSMEYFGVEVIYLRAPRYRKIYEILLERFPTVMEVNTLDLAETRANRKAGRVKMRAEVRLRLTRGRLFSRAKGIVCVTHEIMEDPSYSRFGKPMVAIPNGIRLGDDVIGQDGSRDGLPKLVFVGTAHGAAWHGLDEILTFAESTQGLLEFVIIGGQGVDSGSVNVSICSSLPPDEMGQVMADCDVGIGSCALHKNQMKEACPLKTRSYASAGLPLLLPYRDTAFVGEEKLPWWVMEAPNEAGGLLSVKDEIVRFAKEVQGRKVSRAEAEPFFAIEVLEKRRIEFLAETIK